MKKLSTYLFLIFFSFQAPSWTDDVRDFQIEGMSVGDSLLDYFSEDIIKSKKEFLYKNQDYFSVMFYKNPRFEVYDSVQFHIKKNDKKYKISTIAGLIYFKDNINDCYNKKNEIISELNNFFSDNIKKKYDYEYKYINSDKSGKSISNITVFELNTDDAVRVMCDDWSEKMTKAKNYWDALRITIEPKEFILWMKNKSGQ